jgi:hypothetical protein
MSSFSCPYVFSEDSFCLRLHKDCVPGRPGCALANRFHFAVPVEKRIADKEKENKNKRLKDNKNHK